MSLLDGSAQRRLLEIARSEAATVEERQAALGELLADFQRPALAAISRVLAGVGAGAEHADEAWARAVFRFYTRGLEAFAGRAKAPDRPAAAPRSYFVRLAINAAVDVCRQLARQPREGEAKVDLVQAPDQPPAPTPIEALEARELALTQLRELEALRRCIASLPPKYRQPVQLYYLSQVGSCEVCAAQLGLRKDAFMQRLSRARRQLASCVGERLALEQEVADD